MIEIKNLYYKLDKKQILKDINLTFEEGKVYGIIGPNGAGKSTILKHIMRIIEPKKDTIFINNQDIIKAKTKEYSKKVSFVFQENVRDVEFTVEEVIMMGRYCYMEWLGNITDDDKKIVNEIIEELNLQEFKDRYISTLSGGEAQKVFIGRALAQNTPIILLDEPTSMLDIHNSIEIMNLIMGIKEKYNLTVIMVLHDLNVAFSYCDHITLLKNGEVVLQGENQQVIENDVLKEVYNNKIMVIEENNRRYIIPKIN